MSDRYEPAAFEAKWREKWKRADLFKTREDKGRPKFYGADFFPYPSGAGLSVGHCRNYVPTDVICRMKYMQGYNVLHPMGFDAFGLPAENEAIKRKRHPSEMIDEYTATYRRQMELIGISYDWSRSFASSDPEYYRWTEWIFELLYKRGLAYRKLAAVNWDPVDKTVLADEEIVGGRAERSGALVEKKWIPQWFFKITDYAQRLLDDLETIEWPEGIKAMQRNWIGRSEGVQFSMKVAVMSEEMADALRGQGSRIGVQGARSGSPPFSREASEKSDLKQLEEEVRAGMHEPQTPKSDAELKAMGHVQKIGRLIHEGNEQRRAADDAFGAAAAKIKARSEDAAQIAAESSQGGTTRADGPLATHERQPHIEVFTTRIDTVFGVTFCVLAPEHPMVDTLLSMVPEERRAAMRQYRDSAGRLTGEERQSAEREKTGVFTGAYAINPVNGHPVPIWIADYVLMDYGTGAIMAVPGHDQRDFDFALKHGLDILPVVRPTAEYLKQFAPDAASFDFESALHRYQEKVKEYSPVFVSKESVAINSGEYTGLRYEEFTRRIGEWFEGSGRGKRVVQFKLRDWLISRQRYWGCPIPVLHKPDAEMVLVPEEQLPVLLPPVENYEPSDDGQSPLARISSWVETKAPDGTPALRETDTMGGFACSSWYFLRFCDPRNAEKAWSVEEANHWMPVDCYVGGAEHAVMHLLYARFWTKVFYDVGLVKVKEPFQRLENQGQVLAPTPYRKPKPGEKLEVGEEGVLISYEEADRLPKDQVFWRWARMSKSKGNVVTPDEAVEAYGADALRLYLLFVAPFSADVQWENKGMEGTSRFLSRVFRFVHEHKEKYSLDWRTTMSSSGEGEIARKIRRATHQTIRKVSEDIERFAFNTYVSALMTYVNTLNELTREAGSQASPEVGLALSEAIEALVLLLSPGAPHSADELWAQLGREGFTYQAPWPQFDAALAVEDTVTIAVQVNGKLRDTIELPATATKEELQSAALASPKVKQYLNGGSVRKVIVVPGRLVNVVVA